ncbi:MAG: helix-turn-helix transcriptional regulator [Rhodobacteraceae bacterium]|nr:helix-turn-helix transcriptional regulator [Paracoccaceae bacterium]
MTGKSSRASGDRRQPLALAAVLLLQGIAAVFFVGDAVGDMLLDPTSPEGMLESLVALALVAGVVLSGLQLRTALERLATQERTLDTARGKLSDVIATQFQVWGLTPAERDVGLLALKGLDVADIAALRGAAQGTVRAQLTRIYAKAGVSGRAQFGAWFVEDLLEDDLTLAPNETTAATTAERT